MIVVSDTEGTFYEPAHARASSLVKAVMPWEQVPKISVFWDNTAAFIDHPPADAISNAAGDRNYVGAQVLAPGAQLKGRMGRRLRQQWVDMVGLSLTSSLS